MFFFSQACRGVVASKFISKSSFLLQYCGEICSGEEGNLREENESTGYRFFFKFEGKEYW